MNCKTCHICAAYVLPPSTSDDVCWYCGDEDNIAFVDMNEYEVFMKNPEFSLWLYNLRIIPSRDGKIRWRDIEVKDVDGASVDPVEFFVNKLKYE